MRSFELAYGYARNGFTLSLTAFDQRAEDQVLRDAEGFNVSAGKTDSDGVEGQLSYAIYPTLTVAGQVTYARHRYAFSRALSRGGMIQKGDDVDTAPRWLGSAQLRWTPSEALSVELENVTMGDYFMDAENTARYDGHRVWNLRGRYAPSDQLAVACALRTWQTSATPSVLIWHSGMSATSLASLSAHTLAFATTSGGDPGSLDWVVSPGVRGVTSQRS